MIDPRSSSAPHPRSCLILLASIVAAAVILVATTRTAEAIPAFARRYETSCQTCHLVFPRLTPFGEAFRRNGYRFPEGGDALSEKEEPLPLGAEAQRDVWPKVVYPGQLPGRLPLSILLDSKAALGPHIEGHGAALGASTGTGHDEHAHNEAAGAHADAETKLDFSQLGVQARLLSGGTFGDVASFFASISFGGHAAVEVERAWVTFHPAGPTALHVRVGSFEPSLHGITIHRGIFGHMLRLTSTTVEGNAFAPEPRLQGVELSGVAGGRAGWVLGAVQNNVPAEDVLKDVYARAEFKLGGMRLDGVGHEAASAAWRERSFTLGASGYVGNATATFDLPVLGGGTVPSSHEDEFVRVGLDAHAVFDDLLVDAVLVRQKHDQPTGTKDDSRTLDLAFAELTYVTWPWLFPSLRFEAARLGGGSSQDDATSWIGVLGLNAVVRPNLSLRGEASVGADPGDDAGFRFAALSVTTAF
ncbi:MAG: hypothetical protein HY698_17340 [Deltaproteobacteria bacterium]|nr:hypothetical protein [Deltaproteobacteria bacterium]